MKPGIYQHYKGAHYQVLGLARHSETLEELVVYQAFYGGYGLWVRPISIFEEAVIHEGQTMPRFKWIAEGMGQVPTLR